MDGLEATVRFHHLKLDSNGRPRWKDLADNLANHILSYCFSTQKRGMAVTDVQILELRREARDFFRDTARSGEAGEMLLYFILEAVLRAPQMVSKISLKTNPEVETFGSDGIHMKWHEVDQLLDVFFGEAKIYKSLGRASSSAAKSIEAFHANSMEAFELRLLTRNFKYAEGKLKEEILSYVNRGTAVKTVRVNHACLLGYNWDQYESLPQKSFEEMTSIFEEHYLNDRARILKHLNKHFSIFKRKRLRFEVIVLPFQCVDKFREAFLEAL